MFARARRSGRSLLVLGAVAAIATACSGNASTPTPAPTLAPTPTQGPAATSAVTPAPVTGGCDLNAAGTALAGLDSYQFTMVLGGAASDAALQSLGLDPADSYTLTGTIVNKPALGADITIKPFHLVEVGGFDYVDYTGDGTFTQVPIGGDTGPSDSNAPTDTPAPTDAAASPSGSDQGQATQFSPAQIYQTNVAPPGITGVAGGYTAGATEEKDGVQALHCTASKIALEAYGSTLGVTDANWTGDVWIATTGGYPVSVALTAKAKDGSIADEVVLDLTKVNDPANAVVAPTNIGGA